MNGDMQRMLDTRSHAWREVGLARQLSTRAVRRARIEVLLLLVLTGATLALYFLREELFGIDAPIRLGAAAALLLLGFGLARDLGRVLGPALFRRMDPGTAGTVGFLIRLFFAVVAALVALRVAGLTNANRGRAGERHEQHRRRGAVRARRGSVTRGLTRPSLQT